ncbi:FAD binding domain-containing protein [Desulfobacterales bacterium HSG2]|nr:FAD binding domain-containing protein [Desulfobacterales bacterium HSG2]
MVNAFSPQELTEALQIRRKTSAIPFAGGTNLMVIYKKWTGTVPCFPGPVLFLNRIRGFSEIRRQGADMVIAAGCTLSEILKNPLVPEILRLAVKSIAAPAIRNIATLAGNICHASPAGDALPALYVMDATVKLQSVSGERILPLSAFITGPGQTVLKNDELLTEIILPESQFDKIMFRKIGMRKANAVAKVSIAALASSEKSHLNDVRIAFGSLGPTVIRSEEIEKKVAGEKAAALTPADIVRLYAPLLKPIDDQRSTAAYRKHVALNLLHKFLELI